MWKVWKEIGQSDRSCAMGTYGSPLNTLMLAIVTIALISATVAAHSERGSDPVTPVLPHPDSVDSATNRRERRATTDGITCPDKDAAESDCPSGCERTRLVCAIYYSMFETLADTRTSGSATLTEVSKETCAARCAQLAPDCLHFSYAAYRGQCILGCRKSSSKCKPSGDIVRESLWTLHMVSARKLASLGRQFLGELGADAGIGSKTIGKITGGLAYPGRFGERDFQHAGTHALVKLLDRPPQGVVVDGDDSIADMIANTGAAELPSDCGRVPLDGLLALIPFVVNGRPAAPGQYPWQARILVLEKGSLTHRCGGIIITDRHVLTAAHCLRNVAINAVEVSVGEVNLDEPSEYRERYALENMFFHENYTKGGQHNNDIMLLRIRLQLRPAGPVGITFSDFVQPACLPRAGLPYDSDTPLVCEVSGWGSTSSAKTVNTNHLRAVDVPLVSDQYCGAPEAYGAQFSPDIMFCAGYTDPGKGDSCGGDSGGPLVCPLGDSGRYAVYGVVSHGHWKGCGQEPGVYSRVEHFSPWILDKIRILG